MFAPSVFRRTDARAPALAPWQPWAALAAVALPLHLAWEMLQAPLYVSMTGLSLTRGTWICTRASLADLGLSLLAYGVVAVVQGTRAWLLRPSARSIATYLTIGIAATTAIEVAAVYHGGRWSYAPSMPLVAGIGVAPLIQWIVVPILTLWLVRHYLRRGSHHIHQGEMR